MLSAGVDSGNIKKKRKKQQTGPGEMAQCLKVCAVLVEDSDLVPSTQMVIHDHL